MSERSVRGCDTAFGYKRTEIGIIPAEWELFTGEQITALIGKGGSPRWQGFEYANTGMLFVTSENVRDGFLDIREPKYLPMAFHDKLKRTKLAKHDILINLVGASIGRSCQILHELGDANVNQAVAVFRVLEHVSSTYVACYFQAPTTIARIFDMQVDAARPNISLGDLRRFLIPLPPPPEQRAIAAALSDVDALIGALDRLVAKKRDLKQAAMQQLLTGQTRLPGFAEQWHLKRLGGVAHIKTGSRNNDDKVNDGAYPLFVRSQTIERIDTYSYDCEAVLVPGEGGIGRIFHYIRGKFDCHQRVYKISAFDEATCGKFIFYLMSFDFHSHAMRNSVKATVDSLRLPTFKQFEFLAPPLDEQIAIAAVLSDMDAEITALEQRSDKTLRLKQGMMQELLTGRIRLA